MYKVETSKYNISECSRCQESGRTFWLMKQEHTTTSNKIKHNLILSQKHELLYNSQSITSLSDSELVKTTHQTCEPKRRRMFRLSPNLWASYISVNVPIISPRCVLLCFSFHLFSLYLHVALTIVKLLIISFDLESDYWIWITQHWSR